MLGVLLRAIYHHIILIIQLLLRGGQYPRFRVEGVDIITTVSAVTPSILVSSDTDRYFGTCLPGPKTLNPCLLPVSRWFSIFLLFMI